MCPNHQVTRGYLASPWLGRGWAFMEVACAPCTSNRGTGRGCPSRQLPCNVDAGHDVLRTRRLSVGRSRRLGFGGSGPAPNDDSEGAALQADARNANSEPADLIRGDLRGVKTTHGEDMLAAVMTGGRIRRPFLPRIREMVAAKLTVTHVKVEIHAAATSHTSSEVRALARPRARAGPERSSRADGDYSS